MLTVFFPLLYGIFYIFVLKGFFMIPLSALCDVAIKLGTAIFTAITNSEKSEKSGETKEILAVDIVKKIIKSNGLHDLLSKEFCESQIELIITVFIKSLIMILNEQIGKDWIDAFDLTGDDLKID